MHKNINSIVMVLFLSVLPGSITPALAVEASTVETPATTNEPMVQEDSDGFVLYGALTFGGDALATATNEDGDDVDLDAGGLFHLALGYEKRFDWGGIRATLGYKFDTLNAENGDAEITRFPLEAVVYKSFGGHKVGGGLVHELSPQFELSIDGTGSNTFDFEDATGFVVYYGYSIGFLEWGGRYTLIEYKPELSSIETVDANNFGLYVSSYFD